MRCRCRHHPAVQVPAPRLGRQPQDRHRFHLDVHDHAHQRRRHRRLRRCRAELPRLRDRRGEDPLLRGQPAHDHLRRHEPHRRHRRLLLRRSGPRGSRPAAGRCHDHRRRCEVQGCLLPGHLRADRRADHPALPALHGSGRRVRSHLIAGRNDKNHIKKLRFRSETELFLRAVSGCK